MWLSWEDDDDDTTDVGNTPKECMPPVVVVVVVSIRLGTLVGFVVVVSVSVSERDPMETRLPMSCVSFDTRHYPTSRRLLVVSLDDA